MAYNQAMPQRGYSNAPPRGGQGGYPPQGRGGPAGYDQQQYQQGHYGYKQNGYNAPPPQRGGYDQYGQPPQQMRGRGGPPPQRNYGPQGGPPQGYPERGQSNAGYGGGPGRGPGQGPPPGRGGYAQDPPPRGDSRGGYGGPPPRGDSRGYPGPNEQGRPPLQRAPTSDPDINAIPDARDYGDPGPPQMGRQEMTRGGYGGGGGYERAMSLGRQMPPRDNYGPPPPQQQNFPPRGASAGYQPQQDRAYDENQPPPPSAAGMGLPGSLMPGGGRGNSYGPGLGQQGASPPRPPPPGGPAPPPQDPYGDSYVDDYTDPAGPPSGPPSGQGHAKKDSVSDVYDSYFGEDDAGADGAPAQDPRANSMTNTQAGEQGANLIPNQQNQQQPEIPQKPQQYQDQGQGQGQGQPYQEFDEHSYPPPPPSVYGEQQYRSSSASGYSQHQGYANGNQNGYQDNYGPPPPQHFGYNDQYDDRENFGPPQRSQTSLPDQGFAPPPRSMTSMGDIRSMQQNGARTGSMSSLNSRGQPTGLPAHPAPYRPGLQQQMSNQARNSPGPGLMQKPPPVRNYAGSVASQEIPQQQQQMQMQQQRPSSNHIPPSTPGPGQQKEAPVTTVTSQELDQLRIAVNTTPNDQDATLLLARKLVLAADLLTPSIQNAKERTKTRERWVLEAHKLLKKLVAQGNTSAQFYLADAYGRGALGLETSPSQAFTLYQSAAKAGHAAAAYRTAVCCEIGHEDGGGTRKDPLKAMQWYKRAAVLGDVPGMYKMGMIMLKGLLGQRTDEREAVMWLKRAAERADEENPHALHELALLYSEEQKGSGSVLKDERYALELFHQAAGLGYKFSQFRLGSAYEFGLLGCPISPKESIQWYSKAAVQEEHQSELALSGWYLTGAKDERGNVILAQSDTEAFLWARKAAVKGLAKAEYAMGYFLEMGIGSAGVRDQEGAMRWYWRAAAQNFPKARERLEELKRGGRDGGAARERISRSKVGKHSEDSPAPNGGGKLLRKGIGL